MMKEAALKYDGKKIAVNIGRKAFNAMLEEVYTTPKPGLVDLYSNGAHKDMNVHTFEKSAMALYPYFVQMAFQGYYLLCTPKELFAQIRKTGLIAEKTMYGATGGVNTHKGLIFTLGIFSAAAGRCMKEDGRITKENLTRMQIEMTQEILLDELSAIGKRDAISNGEKNQKEYGTLGIRGEAVSGYPGIWEIAFPVLKKGLYYQKDWNLVKLQVLMTLMSRVEDSNILSRKNPEILRQVQTESEEFLKSGGAYAADALDKLRKKDAEYSKKGISAGGCADLLAAAVFINMLLENESIG